MRVLISVDMEGVAGVVAPEDVSPGNPEYERNRRYMTDEASAAVRGVLAVDPGASVVVVDAHARFRNVLPDRLERGATLVRGLPRRLGMVSGLDGSGAGGRVDAVFFLGYHGRAGTGGSVLAHTVSGATLAAVRCNGRELGELGLNAALAAHFGAVPVLATGDDTLAREAEADVPGITTVTTKWALGNRAAESLHPAEACARIETAATAALTDLTRVQARVLAGPVELEVDFLRPAMTELAGVVPGVERRGPLTLAFTATDLPAALDLLEVFVALAGAT